MLKKHFRLKKKKDFERVQKQARAEKGSFLILKFIPNKEEKSRIGFVCSKKVSRKAIVRNRTKRRMRAAVKELELAPGYDIVIFAKTNIKEKSFWEIKLLVKSLLQRACLLQ